MSTVEQLEDQEDQPHVGWTPRVLKGGKGPPEGPTDNWLSDLDLGTVFVCSGRNSIDGNLFTLVHKRSKFALLHFTVNELTIDRYVNITEFCKQFPVYEILGRDNLPQEGDNNEQRNPD